MAAIDMPGAQVAACDYAPAGWPEGTYTLVRRVAVAADDISGDPRARRRRTIPADQLLALGDLDQVYAVSFIVTNIPIYNTPTNGATLPAGADTATSVEVGSATAPTSKNASKKPNTVPRQATSPPVNPSSTPSGCGPRCSR